MGAGGSGNACKMGLKSHPSTTSRRTTWYRHPLCTTGIFVLMPQIHSHFMPFLIGRMIGHHRIWAYTFRYTQIFAVDLTFGTRVHVGPCPTAATAALPVRPSAPALCIASTPQIRRTRWENILAARFCHCWGAGPNSGSTMTLVQSTNIYGPGLYIFRKCQTWPRPPKTSLPLPFPIQVAHMMLEKYIHSSFWTHEMKVPASWHWLRCGG